MLPVPGDKGIVLGGRVNALVGVAGLDDTNAVAVGEDPQLLELLGALERDGGQPGQRELSV